jgi:hypothetical protein
MNFGMNKNFTAYAVVGLIGLIGASIGSSITTFTVTNNTLKLCNQKPNECKFKYDILMYNETGRVPYPNPAVVKPNGKKGDN